MRSFSASGSATTALWVNQALADNGSDSISSVLKLRRVEPHESSKTPAGRRERKNEAASSVEVEGLGVLLAGYSDVGVRDNAPNGCSVPKIVHCQQEPSKTSYEYATHVTLSNDEVNLSPRGSNDPFIDHAAGLLIALSHGAS